MASFPLVMEAYAGTLTGDGVTATHDPIVANNNRPCLLVVPPALDYAGGTFTDPTLEVRIIALSSHDRWTLETAQELAGLVDHAAGVCPEVQRAEPTLYELTPRQLIPAYILTLSTY